MTKSNLTRKQFELLKHLESHKPMVIYQLAKLVGRPYRRVHDHVHKFVEMGLVNLQKTRINNRDAMLVVSNNNYYQRLMRLDDLYLASIEKSDKQVDYNASFIAVVRKLYNALEGNGVLTGSVCGSAYGLDRFTHDIELATDLQPGEAIELLSQIGLKARLSEGEAHEPIAWVITGSCDDIPLQIIPAESIGVNVKQAVVQLGIGIASEKDFITSKCIAGGQQDLRDVAIMALQNKSLMWFVLEQADEFGCRKEMDAWIKDNQLISQYGA